MAITPTKKINMIIYFENLTIDYMFFIFLTLISNFVLIRFFFSIWFVNLFFMHNFILQKLKI